MKTTNKPHPHEGQYFEDATEMERFYSACTQSKTIKQKLEEHVIGRLIIVLFWPIEGFLLIMGVVVIVILSPLMYIITKAKI